MFLRVLVPAYPGCCAIKCFLLTLLPAVIIIIIINEKINVAFSHRTAGTRNSHKQELSYCRGWPTVREQLKRLCLHRRCVEYLATGNFYLLA